MPFPTTDDTHPSRGAGALFIAFALLLPFSALGQRERDAASATPCWQLLMNQWYQGEIKTIFPLDCYHQAIQHLPTDIQVYSSARDDITKALQAAVAYDTRVKAAALAAQSEARRPRQRRTRPTASRSAAR